MQHQADHSRVELKKPFRKIFFKDACHITVLSLVYLDDKDCKEKEEYNIQNKNNRVEMQRNQILKAKERGQLTRWKAE